MTLFRGGFVSYMRRFGGSGIGSGKKPVFTLCFTVVPTKTPHIFRYLAIDQPPHNGLVTGSSPVRPTKFSLIFGPFSCFPYLVLFFGSGYRSGIE